MVFNLTTKQKEILIMLYRFRFVTVSHVQQFFNHSDSRRIRIWLKDLKEKGVIQSKFPKNNQEHQEPEAYFLTVESREILKGMNGVKARKLDEIKRENARTDEFISKNLFVCDLYFQFLAIIDNATLHFFTKRDIANFLYFFKPYPMAYIAVEHNGEVIKRYFLDMFDDNDKREDYRKRIERYFEYFTSNEWEENTKHSFPSILLIAQNKDMKDYCYRVIKAILAEEGTELCFFLSTKNAVKFHGVKKEVWQKIT